MNDTFRSELLPQSQAVAVWEPSGSVWSSSTSHLPSSLHPFLRLQASALIPLIPLSSGRLLSLSSFRTAMTQCSTSDLTYPPLRCSLRDRVAELQKGKSAPRDSILYENIATNRKKMQKMTLNVTRDTSKVVHSASELMGCTQPLESLLEHRSVNGQSVIFAILTAMALSRSSVSDDTALQTRMNRMTGQMGQNWAHGQDRRRGTSACPHQLSTSEARLRQRHARGWDG